MAIIYVEQLNSTNAYAKSNIDLFADKDVVICDIQTDGRGRMQRAWSFVGEDNIYLSFVLKPSDKYNEIYSNLTQYLSVVLTETIEDLGIDAQIKWPNDVLINGKKVAGILAETVMQGANFKGLVLGIGVNLNSSLDKMNSIDRPATALNLELHKDINKKEFVQNLIDKFFLNYEEFLNKGFEFIKQEYLSHASFLDKEVAMQVFNTKKYGLAKGVTDNGALILQNEKGFDEVVTIGDIL